MLRFVNAENGVRAHILIFMDASPKALLFRHIRTAYIRLRIPGKITQAYITNHSQQSESHLNVFTKGSSPSSLSSSSAAAASGLGSASSGSIPSTFSSTHKYTTLDEEKSSHASHHLVVLVRYPRGALLCARRYMCQGVSVAYYVTIHT